MPMYSSSIPDQSFKPLSLQVNTTIALVPAAATNTLSLGLTLLKCPKRTGTKREAAERLPRVFHTALMFPSNTVAKIIATEATNRNDR